MAKIITRSEVNAIVEGTFSTDLTKAVLYGEVSGNPNFIVSAVNSVSQLNYTASQALLEVDIRRATSLTVTLTPRTTDILSTDTTIVFDITTGGTGTITSLEPVVVTRGGVDISANFSIAADGKTATLTFPQNTTYSPMEIDVRIKAVTIDGDFPSNTSVLYQNPASRLEFANSTSNQDSTATTTTQAFYNNNCTNVGVYSATTDTTAVIQGLNTIITFPVNDSTSPITRMVCISGETADGNITYTYHTITHDAAVPTGIEFRYIGSALPPSAGSIPSSDFVLTLTNTKLTSYQGTDGITVITGGTLDNPTIGVTYSANDTNIEKEITISLTVTNIYGKQITKSVAIVQSADTYVLTLTPDTNPVVYYATANTLTISFSNVSNVSWDSTHSSGINNCIISDTVASVAFSQNTSESEIEKTVRITGTTRAGREVYADASFRQNGASSASISITMEEDSVGANVTGNTFTLYYSNIVPSTLGYYPAGSVNVDTCSMAASSITFGANADYNDRAITLAISGTSLLGETIIGTVTFTQQGRVVPVLTITYNGGEVGPSSGSTSNFTITKEHIKTITGYSVTNGGSVQSSGQTSVTISYPANPTDSLCSYIVTVSGTDVYDNVISARTSITQSADSYVLRFNEPVISVLATSTRSTLPFELESVSNVGILNYTGGITGAIIASKGNNVIIEYPENTTTSGKEMSVTISGTTQGGRTVTAECQITQQGRAVSGIVDVSTGDREYRLGPSSGSNSFDVTWSNLKPGSTITLTGVSGMGSISPASITVGSSGSGTSVVSFDYGPSSNTRILTLTASGIDNNDEAVSGESYFQQYGDSNITVSASTSHVAYNTTVVIFNVSWTDVWGRINFSSNIGTLNRDYVFANGSGSQEVRVSVSINQSASPRDITLTASPATFTVAGDSATTVQDGMASEGSISVTPDGGVLAYDATQMIFTVSWSNLQSGTTVSLTKSSAISSISPASISITSANAGSGSQNVTGTTTLNAGPSRIHSLTASGVDGTSATRTDIGTFTQSAPTGSLNWNSDNVLVPAFMAGTYDGRDVTSAATFSFSYLSAVTAQVVSGNITITGFTTAGTPTVSFKCPVNEILQQITVGAILLTGKDYAGNTISRTLSVFQEAGVTPEILLSQDASTWTSSLVINLGDGELQEATYHYITGLYINDMSVNYKIIQQGNIPNDGIDVRKDAFNFIVTVYKNSIETAVTSSFDITGNSVYGHVVVATFTATQNAYVPPTPTTYSLVFYWETSDGTRKAGELQYRVNGGDWQTAGMYSQATVSGLHLNDTITYVMSSASGLNYLKYSSTVTVDGTLTDVVGRAVPDAFVVNIGPYDTPDYQTNIFSVSYQTHNGSSGTAYITCNGGNSGTTTISLGTGYTTDDSDYMAYTVRKIGGNILLEGWDLSGTNGSGSNLTQNALDSRLSSMDITDGEPANITLKYRGSYATATINWNAEDASDAWKQIDIVIGDYITISTTLEEDHGTFYYDSPSDSKQCYISGGIGDNQVYKQFYMRIMASDGITQLFHGNCELLYGPLAGINLTTSQLNGSTWYLSNARP